eukprot:CAMPEP_0194365212 /NCGR_PEP_ID=MMETSP0174-20130528/13202_1 /TAXON_ID=216777 /ORGANISM="Proboscia alata, Strain PI-D3" /LENGTH=541 /DNA_ID=CAMNT_0039139733 /DNA_START=31 /DNA_END=1656 /DNA_ORIENTATION=+
MTTYEVKLALYDLSRGMARSLSAQFLGPSHSIEMIPHTGVVVHGQEYYFSNGIQSSNPLTFRSQTGQQPVSVTIVGHTTKSKIEFNAWIRNIASVEYSPTSYDLLRRNCNNFSDCALRDGLNMNDGVPAWILDVPDRFLSSPMGMMVRPMLDGMYNAPFASSNSSGGGGGQSASAAPFAAAPPRAVNNATTISSSNLEINPWANVPLNTPSSVTTDNDTASAIQPHTSQIIATPILDSNNKLLISSDKSAVRMCLDKVKSRCNKDDDILVSLLENCILQKLPISSNTDRNSSETAIQQLLLPHFEAGAQSKSTSFALMLLRLVVLNQISTNDNDDHVVCKCIKLTGNKLLLDNGNPSTTATKMSPAARSMAWCTMSNAFANEKLLPFLNDWTTEDAIDAALCDATTDIETRRVEIRQAAVAFLYNMVIHQTKIIPSSGTDKNKTDSSVDDGCLPDHIVNILCGLLESIDSDTDDTCRFRRLLASGRIMLHFGDVASSLVLTLGFHDAIERVKKNSINSHPEVSKLADDILSILNTFKLSDN